MRIFLFLATNLAVLVVAGIVLLLLGVNTYFEGSGLNLQALLMFCAVFGFAGSFISPLLLSKTMAKMGTRARLIERPADETEQWLVSCVEELAGEAGIGMPQVAIFPSAAPNAFATGAQRDKALVAVSDGMLRQFPREEVRAVMAHEIGHVANGDMITLALLQGVVNTFVMFFARVAGYFIDRVVFRSDRPGIGFYLCSIACEIVFAILASTIVFWFSRRREFRADQWGARLGGKEAMIGALERLGGESLAKAETTLPDELVAFGIGRNGRSGKLKRLFSTHPPLSERIAALRAQTL